jgi:hypothetical protein
MTEVTGNGPNRLQIAVMGAGSWGTTFAKVLADDSDNEIVLWARRPEVVEEINEDHRNGDYLPGIKLPANLFGQFRCKPKSWPERPRFTSTVPFSNFALKPRGLGRVDSARRYLG